MNLTGLITEVTGRECCIDNDEYCYLSDFSKVEKKFIKEAEDLLVEKQKEATYQDWKQERQNKVDNIEVTYNSIVYQGDELSQTRIARVISAMSDTETIDWVSKDNSIQTLNKVDLSAILKEAGIKQTQIWNEGRPQKEKSNES